MNDLSPELPVGGDFLYAPVGTRPIFTTEKMSDEQHEIYKVADTFIRQDVEPYHTELEHKKSGLMQSIFHKAAELGFCMVEVPEAYGGLARDKVTSMLGSEAVARVGSFAVTLGAHTGIGTLPLVYYGTEAQKQKYLPRLAAGEIIAAYALSEPGSGSDALSARTVATPTPDGKSFVLRGTKQWITNAAWADLFTIFAQVDGDKFTAFLVERNSQGLSIGKEEHKLGIRGSSTCQVILDDVIVPRENVLGDIGRGHKIAFNTLNIGRWKLGVAGIGAAKAALRHGVAYALERRQFDKPIASFGLVREKLSSAVTSIYAGESMAYRLGGAIDARTALLDHAAPDYWKKAVDVIDEFTIEASVLKVFGSEACYRVVDDMLQIHGGNGYTEDYPLERMLRDSRINLIFEGTNEINRLIIPATLLKRGLTGKIPLMPFAEQVMSELAGTSEIPQAGKGVLASEILATELCKRAILYAASYAMQKYMIDLKEKQHILGALANCVIALYGMDSVLTRASQAVSAMGEAGASVHLACSKLHCFDARASVFQELHRIAMNMADGDELDTIYSNLDKLDRRYRVDIRTAEEHITDRLLNGGTYASLFA